MKRESIKKNFVLNTILTISSLIVPLITFPYVSRVLLPEGLGKVTFATSIVLYFSLLIQLGIPTYGIKAVACVKDDKVKLSKVVNSLMCLNLGMCIGIYIIFFFMIMVIPRFAGVRNLYLILSITMIGDSLGVEWLYKGLEKYRYITIRSLFFKIISMVLIFIFVKNKNDIYIYAFLTVFSTLGSNVCNFINLRKYVDKIKIEWTDIFEHIKPILILFFMSIATTVYTNLDNIMLGIIQSDEDVGYYSTAIAIRRVLLMVVTSLGAVMLPRASYCIENNLEEQFKRLCKKAMNFVTGIAIPLIFFSIIVSEMGIKIYAGKEFMESANILIIILPTILLVGWSNITGIQMLIPMNKEKIVAVSVTVGAIVDFILNIVFIPSFKGAGAAMATVIAELAVLIVQLKGLGYQISSDLFKLKWKNYFISSAVASGVCLIMMHILNVIPFLELIILCISYFMTYVVLMLILKDELYIEIFYEVKKILKRWF